MATARELLEQADALMRRNRSRDAHGEDTASGIPLLTEAVGSDLGATDRAVVGGTGLGSRPQGGATPAASSPPAARPAGNGSAGDADDIPLLTDVVADLDPISVTGEPHDGGEPSQWPEFAVREPRLDPWTVGGPAPPAAATPAVDRHDFAAAESAPAAHAVDVLDFAAAEPAPAVRADDPESGANQPPAAVAAAVGGNEFATAAVAVDSAAAAVPDPLAVFSLVPDAELAAMEVAGAPAEPAASGAGEAARWEALAEEVRMQVLQRIDIFTDTGLQEQLTARLQPIVDRASADLVATINQQVGQLLRAYVAEAIEREIDKWRQDGA